MCSSMLAKRWGPRSGDTLSGCSPRTRVMEAFRTARIPLLACSIATCARWLSRMAISDTPCRPGARLSIAKDKLQAHRRTMPSTKITAASTRINGCARIAWRTGQGVRIRRNGAHPLVYFGLDPHGAAESERARGWKAALAHSSIDRAALQTDTLHYLGQAQKTLGSTRRRNGRRPILIPASGAYPHSGELLDLLDIKGVPALKLFDVV